MGTPEFATASLKALVEAGFEIAGVITAPDKPAGRGKKLRESDVKQYAVSQGLKVLQPVNLKDPAFIEEFRGLQANLGIVVAFRMLPEVVWSMPRYGTFNLHASLLPQYRGAAPINHAIINGETETGVTTFFLKHEIDTGNILYRKKVKIGPKDTAGELHDRLMHAGAELVLKTAESIRNGDYTLINQQSLIDPGTALKPAPKIFRDDCRINWQKNGLDIYNFIRGLSPYPGAFAYLKSPQGKEFQTKILEADFIRSSHSKTPGTLNLSNQKKLEVYVSGGLIDILEIQAEGKKKLKINDFLNGLQLSEEWKMI